MRKAFAIWLMAGLPVLADSVAATRSWVSNRVSEARAEWRGEVVAATNPVPSWISAAEGRVDARIAGATNGLPERIASVTNGLPERIASVTNGLPAKMAALTNGLPERIAAVTNGLPERIAAVTNGLPEAIAGATNGLPERIAAVTNDLPERLAAVTSGVPALVSAATDGVRGEVAAATGSLWTAIGNIEGVTGDIGALARTNDIPAKVSQLGNDLGFLTNHQDLVAYALSAGIFPDWASKAGWIAGEFCTWKGKVYRLTGEGDAAAQPDYSSVSWAETGVWDAIARAVSNGTNGLYAAVVGLVGGATNGLPERIASVTNGLYGAVAAATNGLPERIASVTNGLPEMVAGSTNGLPERIASVTNGLPERIASVTNGLPEALMGAIAASTNGLPEMVAGSTNGLYGAVAAATNGLPERIASVTNGLPEMVAGSTNGLPERIASVTNGLPERIASVTNGLPEALMGAIAASTNGLPEMVAGSTNGLYGAVAAATNGLPERIIAATNGVMGEVNAATGSLWRAIGNIEGVTADIGALARTNDLPTKVSQLQNDMNFLTNHQDLTGFAFAAGVFPDWSSKGSWVEGEFCTWKGVVYRRSRNGDGSTAPDISPVSWIASDVGTAIAEARPDMSSLTNPIPSWIAASTNGLPERIAATTNGLPAKIASVTNGLPERIAAVTNGLPEQIAAVTNGLPESIAAATNGIPEAIIASTNPMPEWIAASTNGIPALIASSVRAQVAGLDSKAATRLVSADGYRWIDGTGAVWQVVHRALWGGGSADAPVGSGSFGAEGWGLVWTPDYAGSTTGSWDLYRTLSGNGPLVAHFTADGLPYQEGAPFVLTLQECTVDGSAAYVGQQTDNGWYQIADSVGSLHFVSPLTNVVTVVRATNYVDRLTLSDELIRSNDVVSIVTETSEGGLTDWEVHGIPDGFDEERFAENIPFWSVTNIVNHNDRSIFILTGGEGYEVTEVYCVVTNFDDSVLSLQFTNTTGIGDTNAITAVRSVKAVTNVLGLARLSDVTNIVTKPYVESLGIEAGISAQTATNIAEGAMENLRPFVANVATQTLYVSFTETRDTWSVAEIEGYSDRPFRLVWENGVWYGMLVDGSTDDLSYTFAVTSRSSVPGSADATTVVTHDSSGDLTWTKTGTVTEEIPVYDFRGRLIDGYLPYGTQIGDWFDFSTNTWRICFSDPYSYGGQTVRNACVFETAAATNWVNLCTYHAFRVPDGAHSVTGVVVNYHGDTNLLFVATPRSLNALGLARFSDLDKYAVPRQDLTRTVRTAVNMAADYLWDPLDKVCYRRQMSGGFLDYIAVTNIDVTLPENWQALEALEAERRSQQ